MTDDAKGLSEAQQYTVDFSAPEGVSVMQPYPDGGWVKYADYAAIAERLKACEEERGKYKGLAETYWHEARKWQNEIIGLERQRDRLTADNQRLTAERDMYKEHCKKLYARTPAGLSEDALTEPPTRQEQ